MKGNRIISAIIGLAVLALAEPMSGQSFSEEFDQFRNQAKAKHQSFREECNNKYAEFLKESWDWYEGKAPIPMPKEENIIPPKPYEPKPQEDNKEDNKDASPVTVTPIVVLPVEPEPQPKPIEPIKEIPVPETKTLNFDFYGIPCKVRIPESSGMSLRDCSPGSISKGWKHLANGDWNNTLRDCLELRVNHKLCDWAYLQLLDKLSKEYYKDSNEATLLLGYLFAQSGYQMRFGEAANRLIMLFGSRHQIYEKGYYNLNGLNFYPYGDASGAVRICDAIFEGEQPMSLLISGEQKVGEKLSEARTISSRNAGLSATSRVPVNLIEFFNTYPTSSLGGNSLTRWAMYANTPLAEKSKEQIYPTLRAAICNSTMVEAANRLLDWVQTGFEYEYDNKVWGHDRAFFAEETLYYPYSDCEDRSILFSRLVRDLLGLDVALVYYPGHLATAVCFPENIDGDSMTINGRKFTICDPTYIGAPIGLQMPGLAHDKAKAIVLER